MTEPCNPQAPIPPRGGMQRDIGFALHNLLTAVEAMDVALSGVEIDRALPPANPNDEEARRRAAAQDMLIRTMFADIATRVRHIHDTVHRQPAAG